MESGTMKDPYSVLGVAKDAAQPAIRKRFKELARRYHPDVNKTPEAERRFKEITAAYEVIGDEDRRKAFDEFGEASLQSGFDAGRARAWKEARAGHGGVQFDDTAGFPGFGGFGGFEGVSLDELLHGFSGGRSRSRGARPGANVESHIRVPFMDAVRGGTLSVEYSLGGGARQHMDVRIPAGVRTGGTIRLRGRGAPGPGGGPAGDLLLKVEVEEHPLLRRTENDLEMDLPVTLEECLAGGVVDVPTVTGNVRVKVPAGCANGSRLRVTGRGVQAARGAGDLYLVVRPVLPGASEQAAKLARELDALRGADVRGAIVL